MWTPLSKLIDELQANPVLFEPDQLRARMDALDRIDVFNLDALDPQSSPASAYVDARTMQAKLESANACVYEAIRRDIRVGRGAASLLKWLPKPGIGQNPLDPKSSEAYDYMDELLAGVLLFDEPGKPAAPPAADMVAYQPTPARHIFDLFQRLNLTECDLLVDLGSGLGQVPMLTSICTPAQSIGVEVEPSYVQSAQRRAESLNLKRVSFVTQDARATDLTQGTVFYLYTPFTGKMLREMLDALRREAATRDIRICTLGPCTQTVATEDWLDPVDSPETDRITVFRSRYRPS